MQTKFTYRNPAVLLLSLIVITINAQVSAPQLNNSLFQSMPQSLNPNLPLNDSGTFDLYPSGLWIDPGSPMPGDTIFFGCYHNFTGFSSTPVESDIWFIWTDDITFNSQNYVIVGNHTAMLSSSNPQAQAQLSYVIPPNSSGEFFLVAFVDPFESFFETDESNNAIYSSISVNSCGGIVNLPYSQDFSSSFLPECWQIESYAADGGWMIGDASSLSSISFSIPSNGQFIATNDDQCNCNKEFDVLYTPEFNVGPYSSFEVSFDYFFLNETYEGYTESLYLAASVDGSNWEIVDSVSGSTSWQNYSFAFSGYSFQTIRFAIYYSDHGGWLYGAAIDNFSIEPYSFFSLITTPISCVQGSIQVANIAGTAPFSYLWSTGETTSSISATQSGMYTVTVTDALGQTGALTTYLEFHPLVFWADIVPSTNNDGIISIIVAEANWPVTYVWSHGPTVGYLTNLSPGTYTVTVTDAMGCTQAQSFEVPAQQQYALLFDGVDDYVQSSTNFDLNDNFSMSMWINPNSWGESGTFGFGTFLQKGNMRFTLHNTGHSFYATQSLVITLKLANGVVVYGNSPAYSIYLNSWQLIAFTYSNGIAKLYINNQEVPLSWANNVQPQGSLMNPASASLFLGNIETMQRAYAGLLDELKIWQSVLSQSELANQQCGANGQNNLVLYYPMNDGPYSWELQDYSGNYYYGWLNNFNPYAYPNPWQPHACELASNYDLGIVAVLSPLANLPFMQSQVSAPVTVVIKNNGSIPINQQVSVSYGINGMTMATDVLNLSLAPNQTLQHTFSVPFSTNSAGSFQFDFVLQINDDDISNNLVAKVVNVNSINRYAFATRAGRFIMFDLNNPLAEYIIGNPFVGNFVTAGTFFNNSWYMVSYTSNYLMKLSDFNGSVDTIGVISTSTGPLTSAIYGISYHHGSGTLYAIDALQALYSINVQTAVATLIGYTGVELESLACDLNGNLYGVNIYDDNLYHVNPITAQATQLGHIGFDTDYAQDLEFDHSTGELFGICYNLYTSRAELRIFNTYGGYSYLVNKMATSTTSHHGFAIAYQGNTLFNYSASHYSCQMGSITLTNFNGVAPYSIQWSTGETTLQIGNLWPGYYSVTVTDANGNSASETIQIIDVALYVSGSTLNTPDGASQGAVNLEVSGGIQPISYLWSNGATTEDLSNLPIGTYTVTVSDGLGCTSVNSFVVDLQQPWALSFDGYDDFVNINSNFALTDSFTVAMWINPRNWGTSSSMGYATFFAKGNFYMYLHNYGYSGYGVNSLVVRVQLADGTFITFNTPAYSISLNSWQHIAMTYSNGQIQLYINHQPVALNYLDNLMAYGSLSDNNWESIILGNRNTYNRPFAGMIDELKIWHEVRSLTDIIDESCQTYYNTNLLGYWPIDEGQYSWEIYDYSGNYNHGWLGNFDYLNNPLSGWVSRVCDGLPQNDLQLVNILSPTHYMADLLTQNPTAIQIMVKNNGQAIQNQQVTLNYQVNSGSIQSEIVTLSLPPLGNYIHTFNSTVDFSAVGFYNFYTWLDYSIDGDTSNNFNGINVQVNEIDRPAYAERLRELVLFDMDDASIEYRLGISLDSVFLTSGTWLNGDWYATSSNNYLLKISPEIPQIDTIGLLPAFITGLSWDYSTSTAYAIDYDGNLYTLNLQNGALIYVGYTGIYQSINLACSEAGQLYSVSTSDDNLYMINKTNAQATLVGWLGFDVNYNQDMEFDHQYDILYMSAYNASYNTGELREVNLNSGYSWWISQLPNNTSYAGFAIDFVPNTLFDYTVSHYTCIPGSITLSNFNGVAPFTINWSTGDTSQVLSGLWPGLYSVTVSDSNGASYSEYIQVMDYSMYINSAVMASPINTNTGYIDITVQGGLHPLIYSWSTGATTEDLYNLYPGVYYLTVTDANGCQVYGNYEVNAMQPQALAFDGYDDYAYSYPYINLSDSFSISMWINPADWGSYDDYGFGNFFSKGGINFYLHKEANPNYNKHSLVISLPQMGGESVFANSPAYSISLNNWQHIAMSYNNGILNLYINHTWVPINWYLGNIAYGSVAHDGYSPIFLGMRDDYTRPYRGKIDELKIWNSVKSASDFISESCGVNYSGNLQAYWPFDDGNYSWYAVDIYAGLFMNLNNFDMNNFTSGWVPKECGDIPAIDLGIHEIISPKANLATVISNGQEMVKIRLKNMGTQQISQSVSLNYSSTAPGFGIQQTFVNLPPLGTMEVQFNAPLSTNLPGNHTLSVSAHLNGDQNFMNDSIQMNYSVNNVARPAFAERNGQFVMFDLNNPAIEYLMGNPIPGDYLTAGAWANNLWYGITLYSNQLVQINLYSGSYSILGTIDTLVADIAGMSFNHLNNTMYTIDYSGNLYTLNLQNAALNLIGNTGISFPITLAANLNGQLYSVSLNDDALYQINPYNANSTYIGWIGFDVNYNQDMEFDHNTGSLFYTSVDYNGYSSLRIIDLLNGNAYWYSDMATQSSYSGFAIAYQSSSYPIVEASFMASPLSGDAPLTVYFSDMSTGNPTSWFWDFGDGFYSSTQYPVHTYSTPGIYSVTLIAANAMYVDTAFSANLIQVTEPVQTPPGWTYTNTGSNHSILIPNYASLLIDGQPIAIGDFIGVFYDAGGTMACGGFVQWQGNLTALTAWGQQSGMDDGFAENETFQWRIYDVSEGVEYIATATYDLASFPNNSQYVTNGMSGIISLTTSLLSPDWTYSVTGSSHSILILGATPITIDGQPIAIGDYMGIFYVADNGSLACGGYLKWMGVNTALTAWGDDSQTPEKDGFDSGEAFQWIIWKASENVEYNAVAGYIQPPVMPNTGFYAENGMSGITELVATTVEYQYINLPVGWSIFSTYIDAFEPNIDTLCQPFVSQVLIAKNASGMAYWPLYGINMIGNVEIGKGYQIKMASAQVMEVEGLIAQPEDNPVVLNSGWSILGYTRTSEAPIATMLAPIVSEILIVKNSQGMAFWPLYNVNMIGNMIPGQGYQIKMNSSQTLIYPSNSIIYSKSLNYSYLPAHYRLPSASDDNMTLGIPMNAWELTPAFGDEVGVFTPSGVLIGSGVFHNEAMAITMWGEDELESGIQGLNQNESFEIRLWNDASQTEFQLLVEEWESGAGNYEVNAIAIPKFISIKESRELVLYPNMPNPFNDQTRIRFSLPKDMPVRISLRNVLGQELEEIISADFSSGHHEIVFDAKAYPAGTYFYRLEAPNHQLNRSMTITR